jgi:putative transposase
MARLVRIVAPGVPHHVTARGNRREPIFFEDGDQDIYCDLFSEQTRKARVEVWAYYLMPNHVHLIVCPQTADGLALALGAAHRRWASTQAHLSGEDDGLAVMRPVLDRAPDFAALIAGDADDPAFGALRAAETTGRPLGNRDFVAGLERILDRPIARRAPGAGAQTVGEG